MIELRVELGARSYPIYIGPGLLDDTALLAKHCSGSEYVIVSNETVAPLYQAKLQSHLPAGASISLVTLEDGEQFKTWSTLNQIFDRMLADKHSRKTTLIALGGGVVGDITGFAAACYQRGVHFIQVPTSLLAQVDSSVGGKTAVNHPQGKNMIGAFHQPQAVLVDTEVLRTLPAREFSAGMAEIVKYGLIEDAEFFTWLENNATAILSHEQEALQYAIQRSCEIKADIVARDETEQGVRALLNLGHTFGHAIETTLQYQGILHGEAVAIGMRLAVTMSVNEGTLTNADAGRVENLLSACGLPLEPPQAIKLADIKSAMLLDKKVVAGSLRLVLLDAVGQARVRTEFAEDILDNTLATVFV